MSDATRREHTNVYKLASKDCAWSFWEPGAPEPSKPWCCKKHFDDHRRGERRARAAEAQRAS